MFRSALFYLSFAMAAALAATATAQMSPQDSEPRIEYETVPRDRDRGDMELGDPEIRGSGAAEEWLGKTLVSEDGDEMGRVTDVVTDDAGAVREVHAEVGGMLGWFTETVAIPAERILMLQDERLFAKMTAEEIREARSE